jgi:hypothetical protein
MRQILALFMTFSLVIPAAFGANSSVILYLDGARLENELVLNKDIAEVALPFSVITGSLRIKPLDGCILTQVDVVPGKPDPQIAKELAKLTERRGVLNDRLKALEKRESIFASAAKSQSSKAPRKTKLNPEPLTAVRQGTEYAIAQLEEVYRARRITGSELKSLEEKIETMKRGAIENVAKVKLSRKGCRIEVSYMLQDLKWHPVYDFRRENAGKINVSMRAIVPRVEKGTRISVVSALLNEAAGESELPIIDGKNNTIALYIFPVDQEKFSPKPLSSISFSFKNQSSRKLPAGEASCFYQGEYLGKTFFKGANPGEPCEITFGN